MSFNNVDFSGDYPVPNPTTSFFISPTGNDVLGNGTRSNPFKTFTRAYRGLTAWRAANRGSTAHGYLIALNGVYDYTNQMLTAGPQNSTGVGGIVGLMCPAVLQNVTLMADEPLGAKVNNFTKTFATGNVFNAGLPNEYKEYFVDTTTAGVTYVLRTPRSNIKVNGIGLCGAGNVNLPYHHFYGAYKIILGASGYATPSNLLTFSLNNSTPQETVVYLSDPTQLPSLKASGVIGYPAIYGYEPPTDPTELAAWEEENWTANLREWSSFRDDNNQFGLGLTYDFQFIPERGITGAWIRQREDLLPGPNGNTYWLQNTSNPPVFLKDILLEMENNNPGISWTNNVVAFRGGNSNVSLARIVQMDAQNGRFLVDNPATWFGQEIHWLGTSAAPGSGSAQPTMALAFINKMFIRRSGQYVFEDGGKLYLKNHAGNNRPPLVRSNRHSLPGFFITQTKPMQPGVADGSSDPLFTKNIVVAGFAVSGCTDTVHIANSGSGVNLKGPTNVKMTCNLVHDNLSVAGFQIAEGYGKIEVSNNFVLRTDDRALYCGRAINKNSIWQLDEPTLFYNNTCYNWRRGAGIMVQGAEGVRVTANKLYTVGPVAHGDGMAVYSFSHDVEVKHNYIYTPNVIGLAINEIYRSPGIPHKFTNNIVMGGVVLRDSDNLNGIVWKNNTFGINNTEGQPDVSRTTTSSSIDPWWGAMKNYLFRDNVILSTANWMSIDEAQASSGNSYTVFTGNSTWPYPSEFIDLGNKFRGPSGQWYTYSPHNYTATDGLPNWHNNIAPNLYQFDRVLGAGGSVLGMRYPYTETSTFIINNEDKFRPRFTSGYSEWASDYGYGSMSDEAAQQLYNQVRESTIYSRIFVDYPNGNLNIKSGVTAYNGTIVPSSIGTRLPYTIPPITSTTTDDQFQARLGEFWTVRSSSQQQVISNPPPIPNHPITINLSTTDITDAATWTTKNGLNPHGVDSVYSSEDILPIPNIMGNISGYSNPGEDTEIGPSTEDEIAGSLGGGVFVIGQDPNRSQTLPSPAIGTRNDLPITAQVKDYMTLAKASGGQTMSLIIHGKVDPSMTHGEYKTIIGPVDDPGILDEFYKSQSYIAFNSTNSQVTSLSTSSISFRKNPHHEYFNFSPTSSSTNTSDFFGFRDFGTTAEIYFSDVNSAINSSFKAKMISLAVPSGTTLTINEYTGEITNATRIQSASTPATLSSLQRNDYKFNGVFFADNNGAAPNGILRLTTTTAPYAMFTGVNNYFHSNSSLSNGERVGAQISAFLGANYKVPVGAGNNMAIRVKIPATLGSKNLLAYEVNGPTATRLFGGTNNLGIEAGSYIRITGSSSNDGIYKVLSTQDGIVGDTPSNTIRNGGTEFQYLELSRAITPEVRDPVSSTQITIENVSHLPILHIKYSTVQ